MVVAFVFGAPAVRTALPPRLLQQSPYTELTLPTAGMEALPVTAVFAVAVAVATVATSAALVLPGYFARRVRRRLIAGAVGRRFVQCRATAGKPSLKNEALRKLLLACSTELDDADAASVEVKEADSGTKEEGSSAEHLHGRYYLVGSWSDWDFEELLQDDFSESAPGTPARLSLEITLEEDGGDFQIVRNQDWEQVLYPHEDAYSDDSGGLAQGPDAEGHGYNWQLRGRAGDTFRIELRPPLKGEGAAPDQPAHVAWRCLRRKPEAFGDFRNDSFLDVLSSMTAQPGVMRSNYGCDWEAAIAQLAEQKRWGLRNEHFVSAHSAALHACGAAGAWQQAVQLLEDIWSKDKQAFEPSASDYEAAARACHVAGEADCAKALREEVREWGSQKKERFSLTPRVFWNRDVRRMGCGVRNVLDWQGGEPVPVAPNPGTWLLPSSDRMAVEIARCQDELRTAGWRLLTCDPHVVQRLDDKVAIQALARTLQLEEHFPKQFKSPGDAEYPCILKPASGEFGSGVRIVHSADEVYREIGREVDALPSHWLLQELVSGHYEYSTSLLVVKGRILEAACMRYHYDADEYVWPKVKELGKELRSDEPSADHLEIMHKFLEGYSGICNFNYKIRAETGMMCIFEVNVRVGADLACDVPRARAREIFESMDCLQDTIATDV